MSKNKDALSTDKSLAREYVQAISVLTGVTAINVGGSRSVKSPKQAREDSDWDFHVITGNGMRLPQPRSWGLHGEAHCFPTSRRNDTEVWPTDKEGLLSNG